jgi:MraZ protein
MAKTFSGEYHHSLDTKGRLIVPAKFREILGSHFWIGRGFDKCLQIYDEDDWNAFSDRLKALPSNSKQARELVRYFMAGTMEVEIDKQGRILLPPQLRQLAGIDKNVVFVGMGTRGELWSEEAYMAYDEEHTAEDISAISDELLNSGFQI